MDPSAEALIDALMDALHEITIVIETATARMKDHLYEIDQSLLAIASAISDLD